VTYGRKLNLGDFNSATIDCTIWADVKEEEDLNAAMTALWTMAKENVKAQALPLKGKQEAQVKEIFLGLPVETQQEMSSND
jgi:hypothetical protein